MKAAEKRASRHLHLQLKQEGHKITDWSYYTNGSLKLKNPSEYHPHPRPHHLGDNELLLNNQRLKEESDKRISPEQHSFFTFCLTIILISYFFY